MEEVDFLVLFSYSNSACIILKIFEYVRMKSKLFKIGGLVLIKKTLKVINEAKNEHTKLNGEYNEMSIRNKARSKELRKRLDTKSAKLDKEKNIRAKHFDIIRSK